MTNFFANLKKLESWFLPSMLPISHLTQGVLALKFPISISTRTQAQHGVIWSQISLSVSLRYFPTFPWRFFFRGAVNFRSIYWLLAEFLVNSIDSSVNKFKSPLNNKVIVFCYKFWPMSACTASNLQFT